MDTGLNALRRQELRNEREAKLAKLPKWAQQEIRSLEQKLTSQRELITQITGEHDESDVWQDTDTGKHYLNDKRGVIFRLPKHPGVNSENTIRVRVIEGKLDIMAEGYPTALAIRPHVTNVVTIHTVKD